MKYFNTYNMFHVRSGLNVIHILLNKKRITKKDSYANFKNGCTIC